MVETVEYRDIPGYPGYRIGDDGSVWSIWTGGANELNKMPKTRKDWFRLALQKRAGGIPYVIVALLASSGGKRKTQYVHRLVLEAFVGPCPKGMQGCHGDGDVANNRLSNLRWDTPKNNCADRVRHGTACRGEKDGRAKLTTDAVLAIRKEVAEGTFISTLAKRYGVSESGVRAVAKRKSWKHIP